MSSQGNPAEIADRAMALASSFLEGATREIVELSAGDMQALYDASQIVREQATGKATEHAAEHLAFSLITAAHSELKDAAGPKS